MGSQENVLKQILTGYPEQLDRTQDWRYCVLLGTPGLAVADINNDGLEDLYICQETGIPNLLLLQQPDGSVKNVAGEWGVDWIHNSPAAIFADFDNDGDQDVAVVVTGGIIVSSNEGNRFEKKAFLPTADDTRSLSIADFDSDGRLDLYVCVYGPDGSITDRESAIAGISYRGSLYHDATEGGPNSLLHNQGNWQFFDVTEEMGLGEANHRLTLAASWEDYDNDGDLDLYVANDYAPNSLFRNDIVEAASPGSRSKGRFTDVAEEVGASDQANGMSVSWGDHNRDGWMDLYVGNMFSSAGNRITTQKSFKADATEDIRSTLKRFARGNTLLENQGDGTFKDTSESAGVTMGRWAWSSPFVDLNNDGWEDMLIVNGFITGEDKRDL
ncbi:MAG: VCBS repeat-containing protein [Planctomycetaceae bacterium]